MKPTRFGIIGTGAMGLEHIRFLDLIDQAEVVAIADPVERSREWAFKAAGRKLPAFESTQKMINEIELDALVICTPNYTHGQVLEGLWNKGHHLMVEKPLCTTLEDCARVREMAASHNGLVWVGMEYRYMPPVARLIETVREGAVGQLHMVAIREHRRPFLKKVGDWNRFSRNTGGTLVEKCCHFFDLMIQIVGKQPLVVYASGGQSVNHLDERYDGETPDILDNAYVIVEFEGSARGLLDLCMFADASPNEQEVTATGDQGKVECFIPESTLITSSRETGEVQKEVIEVEERLLHGVHHHGSTYWEHLAFLDAIHNGGPVEVDVAAGELAVKVGVAAHLSIDRKRPIQLSELTD